MTTEFYLMLVTALIAVVGLWAKMWKVSKLRMKTEEQRSEISQLKKVIAYEKVRYNDMYNAYLAAHQKYLDAKLQLDAMRPRRPEEPEYNWPDDVHVNKVPRHKRVSVEVETGRRSEPSHVADAMVYSAPPSFSDSSYDSGSCSSSDSSSSSSSSCD